MSALTVNKTTKELFIYAALLFILLLASMNVSSYLRPKQTKVLGTETENKEVVFWQDFLAKNPDYIPGWIEIGKTEKVNTIDPNYFKP